MAAAARLRPDAADRAHIAALVAAGIDWARLLWLARENRVDALLQHGLACAVPDAVPAEVRARLEAYRAANLAGNRQRAARLAELGAALERAGIPFLVFKGPVITSWIYGDLGLRFFWDLDVLVRRTDLARAGALLTAHGYRRADFSSHREDRFFTRYHFAHCFEHVDGTQEIDLHWRLFPANFAMGVDEPAMWKRAVRCAIGGVDLPTLAPEDTLLYLAVHGAKEEWRRLQMICDIAELLRAWPHALDRALAPATEQGAGRMLRLAAHLAHAGLGAPLSDRARRAVAADPVVPALAGHVWRGLEDPARRTSIFHVTRFRRLAHERWRDQARYVLRTATRPRWEHVQSLPVPYALRAAYVLLRLVHDSCVRPFARLLRPQPRTGRRAA